MLLCYRFSGMCLFTVPLSLYCYDLAVTLPYALDYSNTSLSLSTPSCTSFSSFSVFLIFHVFCESCFVSLYFYVRPLCFQPLSFLLWFCLTLCTWCIVSLCHTQVEREARCAEMEADRASNMMEHQKEILSRPKRQWIVSEHRKVRRYYDLINITIIL